VSTITTLYRPTGANELALIRSSGFSAYPPRLPEQPIFYPVLNFDYAAQIARDWNSVKPPGFVGYVTRVTKPTKSGGLTLFQSRAICAA
jgi:hypothetical protein